MVKEKEYVRTHVVLPRELLAGVDEIVGPRERSQFIADAVAEKLARARRIRLAKELGGSLANVDIPGWETRESTERWLRELREGDRERELGRESRS
jgi:hypothetical protein